MFHYKTFTSVPRFQYVRRLSGGTIAIPLVLALVMLSLLIVSAPGHAAEPGDPLESVNRTTLRFNLAVDSLFLKPVAKSYDVIMPSFAKRGVRNFFSNLDDVVVVANDLLQFKFSQAGADLTRIAINTTLGVGGVFNVAGDYFGLEKHDEDFGQTLAVWGVGNGPYVVLPLLGPSTLRDSIGMLTDITVDPVNNVDDSTARDSLGGGRAVDFRARVLPFDELIVGDEYLYIRGAYLQHREYQVNDGRQELAFETF